MASISRYVVTRLSSLKCSAISSAVDFTQKSVANPPRNTLTFSWGVFGVMIDSNVLFVSLLPSLFNVTGGYDMSMAEIQEAAEIITSAVSPNANIIFGATLKPEMEDELVITVIATGFDSDTFRQQEVSLTVGDDTKPAETEVDDEMVKNIDLELDKEESAESFAAEPETNIWENPTVEADDDEDDTPAFLRRRKKNKE